MGRDGIVAEPFLYVMKKDKYNLKEILKEVEKRGYKSPAEIINTKRPEKDTVMK